MIIQFTLQNLILFLVSGLVIAVGIILLPILWNIKKMAVIVLSQLETNQEFINKSIRTIPGVLENVGQISNNLRDTTDKLKISVPVILHEVECATSAAKGSFELTSVVIGNVGSGIDETIAAYTRDTSSFANYFHILEEVIQIIGRTLSTSK